MRILIPDGWYHVVTRGAQRHAIFTHPSEYRHFLQLLQEMTERFRLQLHAYVLMSNHFHLVLSTPEANLSAAMQWLKTSYGMWFNRRHERTGPLFEGRYKAHLFESQTHAWPITRYVHLNPVRIKKLGLDKAQRKREKAGLIKVPPELVKRRRQVLRDYPWSSYGAYLGYRQQPQWLTVTEVLGRSDKEQRRAYQHYVEQLLGASAWISPFRDAAGGLLVGTPEWIKRIRQRLQGDEQEQPEYRLLRRRPDWETIRRAVETIRGEKWEAFAERHGDSGRDLALYVLRQYGGVTLKQASTCVGIENYSAAAQALRRFRKRLQADRTLRRQLKAVLNCIKIKT